MLIPMSETPRRRGSGQIPADHAAAWSVILKSIRNMTLWRDTHLSRHTMARILTNRANRAILLARIDPIRAKKGDACQKNSQRI